MKLFLSSEGIPEKLQNDFLKLVGKSANTIKFTYIQNAADPYPKKKRGFVKVVRNELKNAGLKLEDTDLRKFNDADQLYQHLKKFDVIWCGGGNTWYLRYLIRKSGFETAIKRLIKNGKIYCGDSAGAIIATPTLKYVDLVDDPDDAPEVIEKGLKFVDFTIVPHWGYDKYTKELTKMRDSLKKDGFEVKTITDNQAIVIDDGNVSIIGQP